VERSQRHHGDAAFIDRLENDIADLKRIVGIVMETIGPRELRSASGQASTNSRKATEEESQSQKNKNNSVLGLDLGKIVVTLVLSA
jgi:hypothetical protein